jgi:CubicO group peptidase (beta-lactamase class C family)
MSREDMDTDKQINGLVQQSSEVFGLPSVSVSVYDNGQEYNVAVGLADREKKVAATTNSLYCIGSSTKSFTAAALCKLMQEGLLDLDAPVKDTLPWFHLEDKYREEHLTLRDALSHRSGLPRHDLAWYNTPEKSRRHLVESLAYLPTAFPLRYRMCYQNHMYILVTAVIEEVTGKPWGDYLRKSILSPLNMDSTYISGDNIPDEDERKCRPYSSGPNDLIRIPYRYAVEVGGAGTLYSSTRDMLRWLRFHLEGRESLLPAGLFEELHTPQTIIKPGDMGSVRFSEMEFTSYGLGWFIESYRGHRLLHHGGSIDGFKSMQMFVPGKNIAISALANLNGTQALNAIAYKLVDHLLCVDAIDWDTRFKEAYVKAEAEAIAAMRKERMSVEEWPWNDLSRYAGRYVNQAYGEILVEVTEEGHIMKAFGETIPIKYTGPESFSIDCAPLGLFTDGTVVMECGGSVAALDIPLEPMLPGTPIRFVRMTAEQDTEDTQ